MTVVYLLGVALLWMGGMLGILTVGIAVLLGPADSYVAYVLRNLPRFRTEAVSGTTVGGQIAPLSGKSCAWWRLSISVLRDEMEYGKLVRGWVELWSRESADTVSVFGPSGTAKVSPALFRSELRKAWGVKPVLRYGFQDDPKSAGEGVNRLAVLGFVSRDAFPPDAHVEETYVPAGLPMVAVGRKQQFVLGGTPGGTRVNGVSSMTLGEIRSRASKEAKETWSMARGVGLAAIILLGCGWGLVELAAAFIPK